MHLCQLPQLVHLCSPNPAVISVLSGDYEGSTYSAQHTVALCNFLSIKYRTEMTFKSKKSDLSNFINFFLAFCLHLTLSEERKGAMTCNKGPPRLEAGSGYVIRVLTIRPPGCHHF